MNKYEASALCNQGNINCWINVGMRRDIVFTREGCLKSGQVMLEIIIFNGKIC